MIEKYKPIKIFESLSNYSNLNKDKHIVKNIKKYEINNVIDIDNAFYKLKLNNENLSTLDSSKDKYYTHCENGYFLNYHLSTDDILKLENLLIDNDLCFRCYRKGHYAIDCCARTTIMGDKIEDSIDDKIEDLTDDEIDVFHCSHCNKVFDSLKGVTCHENLYCNNINKNINKIKHILKVNI